MATQAKLNWLPIVATVIGVYWGTHACNGAPQGMTEYQRAQLRLQRQQQELQEANSIRNSVDRGMEAVWHTNTAPTEYGVDTSRTQCITGQDYLGRIVTDCGHP